MFLLALVVLWFAVSCLVTPLIGMVLFSATSRSGRNATSTTRRTG
jgi:hypothetical protein